MEPTAVTPDGDLITDEVKRLVVRRHRNSDEVARVVGSDWAERKPPQHFLVEASAAEDALAQELADAWLHPKNGTSPYSGQVSTLFPWTLAKAFLSSPAALRASLSERLKKLDGAVGDEVRTEAHALARLQELNDATWTSSSKFDRLAQYLKQIGVKKNGTERAVVFAERVPTLHYVRDRLVDEHGFKPEQVAILHGGLTDVEQQQIVDSFKQTTSPIRVLVTGDVASEGVNLHKQCHELVHYDIPWSLIRIEQRNGRIDRYGQKHSPQITSLLLSPSAEDFSGDIRVLHRLLEKEDEAHTALGDAASLMGEYSVEREEEAIKRVLAGRRDLDETVKSVATVTQPEVDPLAALFAQLGQATPPAAPTHEDDASTGLYPSSVDFLREALISAYATPEAAPSKDGIAGGVRWEEMPDERLVAFEPPADLKQRLEVLPQSYLADRKVLDRLLLATSKQKGKQLLEAALSDTSDSSWPEALYLGPQHPVLDWAADRALANLARNQVFVVRGDVSDPTLLLVGTLTNRRGQTVAASWVSVEFPNPANPSFAMAEVVESPAQLFERVGFGPQMVNPGACATLESFAALVPHGVEAANNQMSVQMEAAEQGARERIRAWSERTHQWQQQANELAQRLDLKERRLSVSQEEALIAEMAPTQRLVRPLLLVLPHDHAVDVEENR